jgi:type I restriction enzyme, S subunit
MGVNAGDHHGTIDPAADDWKTLELGQLGTFLKGSGVKKDEAKSGNLPCIRYGEIYTHHNDIIRKFNSSISPKVAIAATKLRYGDLLFAGSGETKEDIGKCVAFVDNCEAYAGGDIVILRLKDANPTFMGYLSNSPYVSKQKASRAQGDAVVHISASSLSTIKISLPSLAEQGAIAYALSDVDQLIASLDQLIAKKRDLKQAAMQQLLTGKTRLQGFSGEWQQKTFGNLGNTYGGLTGKTKSDFGIGDAKYVTFMNVMSNVLLKVENFEHVAVKPEETQNRVKQGDLLFNGSSETPEDLALCSFVGVDVDELFLNSFCFGFRLKETSDADGRFLAYYVRSDVGRKIMQSLAQGSTRYNVSKSAFLKAKLHLPPSAEQAAIVELLLDMDAEIAELEQRRDKTIALKQGMMQELLTGRTRLV